MRYFITSRITNLIAKIAGSRDAENIEPKEPVEFYLNDIAEQVANTPKLPVVDADDNGKVLMVDSGSWTGMPESKIINDTMSEIHDYGIVGFLPKPSDNDVDKLLKVNEGGYELFTPNYQQKETVVNVEGATPTIEPADNCVYQCGVLDSLTISNSLSTGCYVIIFTSGSTPTVTTFPATILGLEDFAAEANTQYEINVLDNRAIVGGWAVST